MRTYSGANAGSQIRPLIDSAKESVWIVSPWLGKEYAKLLASMSQRQIEVRIITSRVDYNIESFEILKACENPNLKLLILERNGSDDKSAFIHSKIYLADQKLGISGSANLTYSGLNTNVETLSIAETEEEVVQMETNFMRLWMKYEGKSVSKQVFSSGTSYSIRKGLPLSESIKFADYPSAARNQLFYHPYYFFEYVFRGSVRSPPLLFEDKGILAVDCETRQIATDPLLTAEAASKPPSDYIVNTEGKYDVVMISSKIGDYREAKELIIDYIVRKNTHEYQQHYRNRSYDRLYVPRRYDISFIKSDFVQVPIFHYEIYGSDHIKHRKIMFASSGKSWGEMIYCPICQQRVWLSATVSCEFCGKKMCQRCVHEKGLIFRKKLCPTCFNQRA